MKEVKAIYLKSLGEKLNGLLGYKKPHPVYFKTRFGIHTFFMKYPIDIVILDKKFQIKKVRNNLSPNKIFLWNPMYSGVLELPSGSIKNLEFAVDDHIRIEFVSALLFITKTS